MEDLELCLRKYNEKAQQLLPDISSVEEVTNLYSLANAEAKTLHEQLQLLTELQRACRRLIVRHCRHEWFTPYYEPCGRIEECKHCGIRR